MAIPAGTRSRIRRAKAFRPWSSGLLTLCPRSEGAAHFTRFSIARNGKLVLEEYFAGFQRDSFTTLGPPPRRSPQCCSAPQCSAGLGYRPKLDRIMLGYATPFANPDPRKQRITLANLIDSQLGARLRRQRPDNSPGTRTRCGRSPLSPISGSS